MSPYFVRGTVDAMFALSDPDGALTPYLLLGAVVGWYEYRALGVPTITMEPSYMKAIFGPALGVGVIVPAGEAIAVTAEVSIARNLVEPSPVDLFLRAGTGVSWSF